MVIDPTFIYANYAEAGLWAGLAAVVLLKRNGMASWLLAGSLLAFGASDVIEARTGAWYEPWWLLLWKGLCIVCILIFGGLLLRKRRRAEAKR